jgi:hypothetical protein
MPLPPNKAAAAARGRDIYPFLVANRSEPTLAKYKPKSVTLARTGKEQPCTVGELLDAIFRTTTNYRAEALRRAGTRTRVGSCLTLMARMFGPIGSCGKKPYQLGVRHQRRISRQQPSRLTEGLRNQ